uniref:Domain of unknown function DB domain-containing protein n=1 Tax=Acrobeloides nanus TaxID=290746 RepID=A0A914D871_9BILA
MGSPGQKLTETGNCFSSGTCGGGGFSIPICLPPPQLLPPTCGGGCGTGYQCGQYGCYRERTYSRARVHGSKSAIRSQSRLFGKERFRALSSRIQEEEDSRSNNPNMMFMQCCENRGLPDACLQKCTFNSYTKDALLNMYFRTDECPIEAAAEIQYCAAQGQDHRECCAMNGVHTTLAGEKCLIFCDQRPGNVTVLDMSYISCYERFDEIKTCFWQGSYYYRANRL